MKDQLQAGIDSLVAIAEMLEDKFMIPVLGLYTDKTQKITDYEYNQLLEMGWAPDGENYWTYNPREAKVIWERIQEGKSG